jgi:hypothetical protein
VAVGEDVSAPSVRAGDRAALQAVNFFMADMHAGIGPFWGCCCWIAGDKTKGLGQCRPHLRLSSRTTPPNGRRETNTTRSNMASSR